VVAAECLKARDAIDLGRAGHEKHSGDSRLVGSLVVVHVDMKVVEIV